MNTNIKVIIGILSIVPLLCLGTYIWSFVMLFTEGINLAGHKSNNSGAEAEVFFGNFKYIIISMVALIITSLGMMIYFIIHTVNNQHIDSTERLVWILVFIFAGLIGFPIYWYMRIWQEPKPALAMQAVL